MSASSVLHHLSLNSCCGRGGPMLSPPESSSILPTGASGLPVGACSGRRSCPNGITTVYGGMIVLHLGFSFQRIRRASLGPVAHELGGVAWATVVAATPSPHPWMSNLQGAEPMILRYVYLALLPMLGPRLLIPARDENAGRNVQISIMAERDATGRRASRRLSRHCPRSRRSRQSAATSPLVLLLARNVRHQERCPV